MSQTLARLAALAIGCCLAAPAPAAEPPIRVATFNLALYGARSGQILERLQSGADLQARNLAEIIQRVRPDVLVLNEIDYDPKHEVPNAFADKYLAVPQHVSASPAGRGPASAVRAPTAQPQPLDYPHRYIAPSNTGRHSGFDLDRNGDVDATPGSRNYGSDCWGYGVYEGQYAFAVLSRFPIDEAAIRTFQNFRWRDMPGALLPDDPDTSAPADWYSHQCLEKFPLSSKNHCDVPVVINGRRIHLLLCHPTPPVFDGPEDRNGRRNQDELRFWLDYVGPAEGAAYMYDDAGRKGGLEDEARKQETGDRRQKENVATSAPSPVPRPLSPAPPSFLILGDLNGDPHDGQGVAGITALLASARLLKHPFPASAGGAEAARLQGGANAQHQGDPRFDTEDPGDNPGPGNLHLDYILPSADLSIKDSGVFWPETTDPLHPLVAGDERPASSDHRLIWVDLTW